MTIQERKDKIIYQYITTHAPVLLRPGISLTKGQKIVEITDTEAARKLILNRLDAEFSTVK